MLNVIHSRVIIIFGLVFLITIAAILSHRNTARLNVNLGTKNEHHINRDSTVADKALIHYKFYSTRDALASPLLPLEPQSHGLLQTQTQIQQKAPHHFEQESEVENGNYQRIESMDDLQEHLASVNEDNIDLDSIVDFVNISAGAFAYVKSEYLSTDDVWLKAQLLAILDNINHEEKTPLALGMLSSQNPGERTKAYEWLSRSERSDSSDVYDVLIDAIYIEDNPHALNDLISMVKLPEAAVDLIAHNRALSRLRQLAVDTDEQTTLNALSKIAEISQSDETRDFLHSFIDSHALNIRKAAIEGLARFRYPGEDVMRTLNIIMENPSEPQELRSASVKSIVEFENYLSAQYSD